MEQLLNLPLTFVGACLGLDDSSIGRQIVLKCNLTGIVETRAASLMALRQLRRQRERTLGRRDGGLFIVLQYLNTLLYDF